MGMMTGSADTGAWILLWIFLALVVAVTAGVVVVRVLGERHRSGPAQVHPAESPAVREAKDALRRRYANGEISREEYLQGKVEIED